MEPAKLLEIWVLGGVRGKTAVLVLYYERHTFGSSIVSTVGTTGFRVKGLYGSFPKSRDPNIDPKIL